MSARFRRFIPHLAIAASALGAGVAIGIMESLSLWAEFPLFSIPFATSIVLVMGAPEAPPSQPRALIGGHLLSTLIGILVVKLVGPEPWAAALAVALAVLVMQLTGTFHPPAGIDPLLVVSNNLSWSYMAVPVGIGALLLTAFAFAWHNLVRRQAWPGRWL